MIDIRDGGKEIGNKKVRKRRGQKEREGEKGGETERQRERQTVR